MADEIASIRNKPGRPRKAGVPGAEPAPVAAATDVAEPAPQMIEEAAEAAPAAVAEAAEQFTPEPVTSPALVNEPIPGPAATTVPFSEGPETMATVVPPSPTETADKAQAMFGDASARMKTAFEKSSKMSEDMVDFAKGNVEALMASSRVAAKAAESLGQEAAEYSRKSFESATAAFKSFATVKSPTELFALQSEFMKSSFDSAVAEASKISEAMLKLAGDIAQPLSTRYALAAEKFKTTSL